MSISSFQRVQRYNIFPTLQAIFNIFLYLRNMFVATIGFFDGVHRGHRCLISQVLEEARRYKLSSMAITMDCHPRSVVSTDYVPSLLTTTEERVALLKEAGIREVEVLHFDRRMSEMDAPTFMRSVLKERLGVKVLVMGYDHKFGHGGGSQEDYIGWGQECGIEVIVARELDGMYASSSEIRRKLSEGDVKSAAMLLGHPYLLTGIVETGHQIGRTLGFPTANLRIVADKLIPANGVYAVETNFGKGIMNIGQRPTLDNGNNRSIEVHIINYDGDLYGKGIQLNFIARIREERKFANLDELRAQIHNDLEEAKQLFEATD